MAARTAGLILVAALAAAQANVAKEATRKTVVPSDIIYGTGSLIYDLHTTAYEAAEGLVTQHGIHTKAQEHMSNILGDDLIGSACKKVGCNKKDVTDKLNQAQATVQQGKAQAYEYGAKASDHLNGVAAIAVDKIEAFVPSYKGALPRNFLDLALMGLWFGYLTYSLYRIGWYGFRTFLSIFCCVCCCGFGRGSRKADTAKKGKNSGKPDAKQAAAKPKGTKK